MRKISLIVLCCLCLTLTACGNEIKHFDTWVKHFTASEPHFMNNGYRQELKTVDGELLASYGLWENMEEFKYDDSVYMYSNNNGEVIIYTNHAQNTICFYGTTEFDECEPFSPLNKALSMWYMNWFDFLSYGTIAPQNIKLSFPTDTTQYRLIDNQTVQVNAKLCTQHTYDSIVYEPVVVTVDKTTMKIKTITMTDKYFIKTIEYTEEPTLPNNNTTELHLDAEQTSQLASTSNLQTFEDLHDVSIYPEKPWLVDQIFQNYLYTIFMPTEQLR